MNNKKHELAKNTLIFMIGGFLPKVLAFFVLPLYTRYLTTSEYGKAELLAVAVSLLMPIISLNIQEAVMRFSLENERDIRRIFTIGFEIVSVSWLVLILGIAVVTGTGLIQLDRIGIVYLLGYYLFASFNNLCAYLCKAIDQTRIIVIGGAVTAVATLISAVIFLPILKLGYTGYILGLLIGQASAMVYLFIRLRIFSYLTWRVSLQLLKKMTAYSTPLILNEIGWWINNASDRYIVAFMSGVAVSGVYAIASKLPNILAILQTVFSQAWSISAIKEFDPEDEDHFIANTYELLGFVMCFSCAVLILMDIPLSRILFSNDFFVAWRYVPPLLFAVVLSTKIRFWGGILAAVKDTGSIAISTVTGAVVNTIGNFLLIYLIGAYGAAVSTVIGYVLNLCLRKHAVSQHMRMHYNEKKEYVGYVLLICQTICAYFGLKLIVVQVICTGLILVLYRKEAAVLLQTILQKITVRRG